MEDRPSSKPTPLTARIPLVATNKGGDEEETMNSARPRSSRGRGESDAGGKKALLEKYRGKATEVIPGRLYVGDIVAASNTEMLSVLGILHIINCGVLGSSGNVDDGISRSVLHLYDSPHEDIGSFLYQVLDAVGVDSNAGVTPGVLLHCEKGVSRSCAFAAACIMYAEDVDSTRALAKLCVARPTCDPNIGFQCQLVEWNRRRHIWRQQNEEAGCAAAWRIAVDKSEHGPRHRLVPKLCLDPASRQILPPSRSWVVGRTTFVIVPDLKNLPLVVWVGLGAPAATVELARKLLQQLRRYEGLGYDWPVKEVNEGSEPSWLVEAFLRWEAMPAPSVTFDDILDVANVPPMADIPHVPFSSRPEQPPWALSSSFDGKRADRVVDVTIEPEAWEIPEEPVLCGMYYSCNACHSRAGKVCTQVAI